jgi:radical S-adenosyl methionine domain-containing protein 2
MERTMANDHTPIGNQSAFLEPSGEQGRAGAAADDPGARGGTAAGAIALPPTVNYHLWEPCNMRCRYCFATFQDVVAEVLPRGHLARDESLRLVRALAPHFKKLTFVGGEPTLCPWLPELIDAAKALGNTTMLVTNGTRLSKGAIAALKGTLDWITLSIDSASDATHVELGRAVRGRALAASRYAELAAHVKEAGMRLKVNAVVTSVNAGEDMRALITALGPERWKILRVLPIDGQNTGKVEPLICSDDAFRSFVERHRDLEEAGITLVPEDNDDVRGSYAMVDPAGRFFDNTEGRHRYSRPILERGVEQAFSEVRFSMVRFLMRGGQYAF